MKKYYRVYLFRAPDCIRGWLAYIIPGVDNNRATVTIELYAENGAKAKNQAIALANKKFKGAKIIKKNYDDKLWGINNFPELKFLK